MPGYSSAIKVLEAFYLAGFEAACFTMDSVYGSLPGMVFFRVAPEPSELFMEGQFEIPGGTVPLFSHNNLGHVPVIFCGRIIDLIPVDEYDDIRILLYRPTLP